MLQPDQVTDSLHAYQLAKRGNSLRVMAEAVRWGKRGARVNTISPGIIITPLAKDELTGPRGEGYRRMIELSAGGRGRHAGRGRNRRRAPHGPGRRVHHRQRLPHGRRRHRLLLLRRTRPTSDRHRTLQEITDAEMRLGCTVLEVPVLAGEILYPASTEEFTNHAAVRRVPNSAAGTARLRDLRCVLQPLDTPGCPVAEIAM